MALLFTHEHDENPAHAQRFIDDEINPHVDAWEGGEIFPPTRFQEASAPSALA